MDKSLYFKNTPLMKEEWYASLQAVLESEFAPKWNTIIGDRITEDDFLKVKDFEYDLNTNRDQFYPEPNEMILTYVRNLRFFSPYYQERLFNLSIESEFKKIPYMAREDLQNQITNILPNAELLERMIVNPTSGTTGIPILAPNHPYAIGCYVPLFEYCLGKHNVTLDHHFENTSAIQLCYQNATIVYAACHSLVGGAKFAKINLKEKEWRSEEHRSKFLQEQAPTVLTGDPYSFEEALKIKLDYKPKAIHSTALELEDSLRSLLSEYFECPIINCYSLNETGPIAYSCPLHSEWMHLLPHDIFIEAIDEEGNRSSSGELVITGGRNPFLPLLRYRTGDFGEINFSKCACGESSPRIKLLKGRKPVRFTDTRGNQINSVDISRILRMQPNILRHQFIQKSNGCYEINLSFYTSPSHFQMRELRDKFSELLGKDALIRITDNLPNDQNKKMIYINENL